MLMILWCKKMQCFHSASTIWHYITPVSRNNRSLMKLMENTSSRLMDEGQLSKYTKLAISSWGDEEATTTWWYKNIKKKTLCVACGLVLQMIQNERQQGQDACSVMWTSHWVHWTIAWLWTTPPFSLTEKKKKSWEGWRCKGLNTHSTRTDIQWSSSFFWHS